MSKRFLPEWYPQSAIQLAWPHAGTDWQRLLPQIEGFYHNLVDILSHQQQVVIAGDPRLDRERILAKLGERGANLGNLRWFTVPTNNTWARDHAPSRWATSRVSNYWISSSMAGVVNTPATSTTTSTGASMPREATVRRCGR